MYIYICIPRLSIDSEGKAHRVREEGEGRDLAWVREKDTWALGTETGGSFLLLLGLTTLSPLIILFT
jgi:hypothetical protein